MFIMQYNQEQRNSCQLKTAINRIVWAILLVATVYVCELLMFKYGPTTTHMKVDVDLLREEVDFLKKDLFIGLSSLRKEFEEELSILQQRVHKGVLDELSCKILNKLNDTVKKIVTDAIELYDADKTGQPDFAMESSGGSIVSTRNTETFLESPLMFGTTVGKNSHSARCIIQACVLPGECWAFKGSTGAVVIQLIGKVYITGVSLEHVPSILSPTGETTSAPKEFSVWGLNCLDGEGYYLGQFSYNNNGSRIQYFKIQQKEPARSFHLIELKIHTNHGDTRYTCVYRFRVHGKLDRRG